MIVDFLVSDYPILLALVITLLLVARFNAGFIRWTWNDPDPPSQLASRLAIGSIFVFGIWATVFDNWRQLLGRLVKVLDEKSAWRSDPFLYGPPPDAVRAVTWLLLACVVLGGAYLFARYARGAYYLPVILWPLALTAFYALNALRMRFELVGPLSPSSVNFRDPFEAVTTMVWFLCFYWVMAFLIFCAFTLLWAPTAIVVALLYRNTVGRQHIEEPDMFRLVRERSATRDGRP